MMRGPTKPIQLRTKRFELRTLKAGDACETWIGWARDPDVMQPLNMPTRQMTLHDLANYIASFDNVNRCLVGVFDKASKALVGFFMIELDHGHRLATFNVLIGDKAWWGKGVVNEARAALLDYFFEQGIEKACGGPLARNFPAIFNYKEQGWRHEGTLRGHRVSMIDGKRTDQYQFGILRSEWRAPRGKR
jgi:[ribosomal protein S5]-alanine N-acetyltransferase